jgi:hypothetical protein
MLGDADSIHVHRKRRKTKSSLTLLFLRRELKDEDEILNIWFCMLLSGE